MHAFCTFFVDIEHLSQKHNEKRKIHRECQGNPKRKLSSRVSEIVSCRLFSTAAVVFAKCYMSLNVFTALINNSRRQTFEQ